MKYINIKYRQLVYLTYKFYCFILEILKKAAENDQSTGHFQSFFLFVFCPPNPKSEKKKNPVNQLVKKFWAKHDKNKWVWPVYFTITGQPIAPQGRDTEHKHTLDSKNTVKVNQPALSLPQQDDC